MPCIVRHRGLIGYEDCYREMAGFSLARNADTPDELWCLEHPPVYTLGMNGKREHLLNPGDIPVVQTDRGGQVTYHGPGQLIVYCLLDLRRQGYGIRELVRRLEQAIIELLADVGIHGSRRTGAPGVYVVDKKIAALGIRVKRGCAWHGLALNVDMDLTPYSGINPCGYAGLEVTRLSDFGIQMTLTGVADNLASRLIHFLELDEIKSGHEHTIQELAHT